MSLIDAQQQEKVVNDRLQWLIVGIQSESQAKTTANNKSHQKQNRSQQLPETIRVYPKMVSRFFS